MPDRKRGRDEGEGNARRTSSPQLEERVFYDQHSEFNNNFEFGDTTAMNKHINYEFGAAANELHDYNYAAGDGAAVNAVTNSHNNYKYRDTAGNAAASENINIKYGATAADHAVDSAAQQNRQQSIGNGRRVWVKERSSEWWDEMSSPELPDEQFRKTFRMSKATFDFLCDSLAAAVAKEDTALRAAVPVRQRVAVAVWRLATGEPLRLVSKRFGLGISTCHKLVLDVCAAIKSVLMPKAIVWPSTVDAAAAVSARFEALSGVPNVVGAMHTTHVPIVAPKVSVAAYFNRRHTERNQKTSYSVTLQGVVDADGVLTDVCIGWPGSMTDEQVLEKSTLFQRAASGHLAGRWIVGHAGYPLTDWVLVPYAVDQLTWTQHAFNERVNLVEGVAKAAFARMKARWGCLRKRSEMKLEDLPVVLGACCVLHNICEMRKEEVEEELLALAAVGEEGMVAENCVRSTRAARARDEIAHNLLHRGLGGMTFM